MDARKIGETEDIEVVFCYCVVISSFLLLSIMLDTSMDDQFLYCEEYVLWMTVQLLCDVM